VGVDDAESFWFPALGGRFAIRPWEMPLVRVVHYDMMLKDMKTRTVL